MTDWTHIMIELPQDDAAALLLLLRERLGFRTIDWCEMQRPDFARVSYGPCEARTTSGYGPETDKKLRGN